MNKNICIKFGAGQIVISCYNRNVHTEDKRKEILFSFNIDYNT